MWSSKAFTYLAVLRLAGKIFLSYLILKLIATKLPFMTQDVILMTFIFTSVSFALINSVKCTEYLALKYKPIGQEEEEHRE